MKRIHSLPKTLRPREKMLKYGASALSLEELLAVIWINGTKAVPVSTLATTTAKLLVKTPLTKDILQNQGITSSKIAQILAALELGKRLAQTKVLHITSANQVFAQSQEILHAEKESLLCFYLNARGEIVKKEILAIGTLNMVHLLPADIFSVIKELPINGIILVHNHPSGNLEPSHEDMLFTKRIKKAGDILGVKLFDHLIICEQGWNRISF